MIGFASLDSVRARDESGFDALVGPLVAPGYKLAVVFLRDPDAAQDAVQEACLKAWRGLGRLRDQDAVEPWFLTIVANECRSMRRTRWFSVLRRERIERRDAGAGSEDDRLDLDREMARLPATDRAVLFLFFYLDLSLQDVARVLRISPQAAKSRVHRAVTRLRLEMVEVAK